MEQLIRQIFKERAHNENDLLGAIESLALKRGDQVYQEIFRYLLRKDFDPARAGRYWREAVARWNSMAKVKPDNLQIRAAILDYLHNVVGEKLTSVNDGLTGLFNWPYGKNYAEKMLAYMRRNKNAPTLALLLFDLDHFREYNAQCGPREGDRVLRQTAEIIREHIREMDVAARHDSGNFALFLPSCNRAQAFCVAERIRASVEASSFSGQELLSGGNLTVSCGIASFPQDGDSVLSLIREGSRELASAKRVRNCICPAKPERRRAPRRKICSVVEFASPCDDCFSTAMALDISCRGISIGCDRELSPGTPLKLRFRRPFWPHDRDVSGTVRQTRRDQASGLFHVGLEFATQEDDLHKPLAISA